MDGVLGDGSVAVVVNCVEGGGKKGLKVQKKKKRKKKKN